MIGARVTADVAARLTKSSERAKRAVEDRLLAAVESNIETSAKQGRTFLFHTVPMYQFGVPLYDCSAMVRAIGKRLVRRGFRVKQVGVNHVYVEWGSERAKPACASDRAPAASKTSRGKKRASRGSKPDAAAVPASTRDAIRRLGLNLRSCPRPGG